MVPMLAASMAERRPDLAREGRDRGLAAGAGDGGDGLRLARIEPRGRQRQRAPRIGDRHEADAAGSGACGAVLADDRRGARLRGLRGTRRSPSALVPGTATNTSPRFTVRLSAVTPVDLERAGARIELANR